MPSKKPQGGESSPRGSIRRYDYAGEGTRNAGDEKELNCSTNLYRETAEAT